MKQSPTTRRRFFQTGTLLGVGLFVPYLYSSEQPVKPTAANDRLNIGAIGTSEYRVGIWGTRKPIDGRGTTIAREAAKFGNMVAVADVNLPFANRFAAYFPGQCKVYQDYRELLSDSSIDVVTVGTPEHWHVKISIDAMKAGKHVYVEKPLTLTVEEGEKICRAARETQKVVQVGTQQRSEYKDRFLQAVAIARSGRLGDKLNFYCSCGQSDYVSQNLPRQPFQTTPVPKGLNWDLWQGQTRWHDYFLERCFYNFRWFLDYSAGEITDWGAHHADIAAWALNPGEELPEVIEGKADFPKVKNWYNTAESFDITATFRDGQSIRLLSGKNEVIISGERGRIRVNRKSLTGKPLEEMTSTEKELLDEQVHQLMRGKKSGNHMKNFFDCIADGSLPVSDVFSTVPGINICHFVNICARLGRKLHWDNKKRLFTDDPEATAMLKRTPRKGYEF